MGSSNKLDGVESFVLTSIPLFIQNLTQPNVVFTVIVKSDIR
jgi:hypothetical protein